MINLDRLCCLIIKIGLAMLPLSGLISILDELIAILFMGIAVVDCIFNKNWGKYKILWVITAIITFYGIYSALFLKYNTIPYIILDWGIELKPFIPFCVLLTIAPRFTPADRQLLRIICMAGAVIICLFFVAGTRFIIMVLTHPTYLSQFAVLYATVYYICSRDIHTNIVSRRDVAISLLILTTGIFSIKAKFFGTYILAVYLMTLYRPGVMRHFSAKHTFALIALCAFVLAASWNKISFYFLTGNSDTFDPAVVESFARPVLYATGALILVDHFPFGTGLASFATFASEQNYSNVYFEYGINNIHGLSPNFSAFICDAFYPSLAQFGVIGLILFIWFWIYAYSFLRRMIRVNPSYYKPLFVAGSIFIIFNLIEATSSTTLTQTCGMMSLSLLGMICAQGKNLKAAHTESATQDATNPNKRKI